MRRAITAMILRFIVRAVACPTPDRRPGSTDGIPFPAVTTGWIAANHTVGGSLVEWRIVPAVGEVRFLRRLHRYNGRRVGKPAMAAARTDEAVAPAKPGRRVPALLLGSERLAERRIAHPPHPGCNLEPHCRDFLHAKHKA